MLENVETMFDEMQPMLKKLKKASYEKNMKEFRIRYHHFFSEMAACMEEAEDKDGAAAKLAGIFTDRVYGSFAVKDRIKGKTQADLNFFMIYYFFPAVLLMENEYKKNIADAVCLAWGKRFKNSNIRYTDYDTMYGAFREKIFGIF